MKSIPFETTCALLLTLTALTAGVTRGDWPGWRGPDRDGRSPDTGLLSAWPEDGPPMLWQAHAVGKGYSSVAVVKGVVYTTGDVGDQLMIMALDAGTGAVLWTVPQGPAYRRSYGGSRSTPVVDGNRLYVLGGEGRLTCHDIERREQVWVRELSAFGGKPGRWGYSESVLIVDDKVIATPGGQTGLVALDKRTGADVWRSNASFSAHYASPIVIRSGAAAVVVQGTGNGLFAVDAETGRQVWSNGFSAGNTANCPDPVYADGYLFWANGYGKGGVCFTVGHRDGAWVFDEIWQTRDMVCHHGGYVIHQGHVYGNHNAGWSCVALETGRTVWHEPRAVGKGSICFADGMLYLFSERDGRVGLAAASPEAFRLAGQFRVDGDGPSWAHPVVIDGRLYLRYDTNLYAFDVRSR